MAAKGDKARVVLEAIQKVMDVVVMGGRGPPGPFDRSRPSASRRGSPMMDPWQEMNVLARRIEAGELDKFLAQVGQAVSRRVVALAGKLSTESGIASNKKTHWDRCTGRVLANQAKLVWAPGDIVHFGVSAPWRFQSLFAKVLRVNQTTLWCRCLSQAKPDRITGYQWFQGFKIEVRHARLVTEPDRNQLDLAAKIPLPGPKLRIGKKLDPDGVPLAGARIKDLMDDMGGKT